MLQVKKSAPNVGTTLTIDDIRNGQASPLDILIKFFDTLCSSSKMQDVSLAHSRALSSSYDAMYAATNGMLNLSKHLRLGIAVKSMTRSDKILRILN